MDNILAEVSEVAGTNMAALGVGGVGLLTSSTSALGRGSFFLSLTENLRHVISLKFLFFGYNVTFQVTIEC